MRSESNSALLSFGAVLAITAVALYPLCAILHRCGCRAPGQGGAAACNVRNESGPHCPWCEHPALGGAATLGTVGAQGLVFRALRRSGRSARTAGLGAILALPPAVVLAGALAWLPTDYPHFLGEDTRSRWGVPNGPIRSVVGRRQACCAHHLPSP